MTQENETPIQARFMPPDYSISLAAKGGTDHWLLNPGTERVQLMAGFEDTYVDIIDYILRITHRIWEQKDIGYIYDTYAHNSHVNDDYGLQYGRDKIVADTTEPVRRFCPRSSLRRDNRSERHGRTSRPSDSPGSGHQFIEPALH